MGVASILRRSPPHSKVESAGSHDAHRRPEDPQLSDCTGGLALIGIRAITQLAPRRSYDEFRNSHCIDHSRGYGEDRDESSAVSGIFACRGDSKGLCGIRLAGVNYFFRPAVLIVAGHSLTTPRFPRVNATEPGNGPCCEISRIVQRGPDNAFIPRKPLVFSNARISTRCHSYCGRGNAL